MENIIASCIRAAVEVFEICEFIGACIIVLTFADFSKYERAREAWRES